MDIENLRKIQEAEKALRIHNINISTQEALDAVKNDINVGGTRVPVFDKFSEQSQIPEQDTIQRAKEVAQMDEQSINEIKKQLGEQAELISKQAQLIHQLQGVINDIIKEINKIQSSVPTKNPAERQQVLKAQERTHHPRSGSYTPDDVSVEKFFNFSGTQ